MPSGEMCNEPENCQLDSWLDSHETSQIQLSVHCTELLNLQCLMVVLTSQVHRSEAPNIELTSHLLTVFNTAVIANKTPVEQCKILAHNIKDNIHGIAGHIMARLMHLRSGYECTVYNAQLHHLQLNIAFSSAFTLRQLAT